MDAEATERKIPVILIISGALLTVIWGLFKVGSEVGLLMSIVGVATVVGTGTMLMAAFLVAALLRVSFGELQAAALKLAGIYLFSGAIALFMPSGFGGLVQAASFVILMMWLFELELPYVIAFGVVNFFVNLFIASLIRGVL